MTEETFPMLIGGEEIPTERLLETGAHCRPWNRCSIGICYEGGPDAESEYGFLEK